MLLPARADDDSGVVMNLTNVNTINKRCKGDETPSKDKCSDGSVPNLDDPNAFNAAAGAAAPGVQNAGSSL